MSDIPLPPGTEDLHPAAYQMVVDALGSDRPNAHLLPVSVARANFDSDFVALGPGDEVERVEDIKIQSIDGTVPIRLYRPRQETTNPLIVYLHGGGWLLGSLDSHDYACRRLASESGSAVLSVGYRLAPEHRFPAGLNDCFAAAIWASDHAASLGALAGGVVLAGDSAGGNLALGVAQLARATQKPPIKLLVLIYPVTTARLAPDTFDDRYDRIMLWRDELAWHQENYVSRDSDREDPLLAPLDNADLGTLPDSLVLLAQCDPIRPQGEALARRLEQAGVNVTVQTFEGLPHGFFGLSSVFHGSPDGVEAVAAAINYLRRR